MGGLNTKLMFRDPKAPLLLLYYTFITYPSDTSFCEEFSSCSGWMNYLVGSGGGEVIKQYLMVKRDYKMEHSGRVEEKDIIGQECGLGGSIKEGRRMY